MKCQEGRICAHWAEKNLKHKQKKILLEAGTTICQLVGSLLEKMILVKAMEGWKFVEDFIFYSILNKIEFGQIYFILFENLQLDKIYFILFKKFSFVKQV